MTWDYLNVFLPSQSQRLPQTTDSYADALTVFRRFITDERCIPLTAFNFEDLTYDFLLDYRIFLEGKYCPATVNHRLSVVKAYMKYAASRRVDLYQVYLMIADVPSVAEPSQIRDIIEDKEALAMLLAAPSPSKIGVRDQTILTVLYDAAIRADELLQLNLEDVNIHCMYPYVRIRHGKGNKERIVELSCKSVPIIRQYVDLYHQDQNVKKPFIYTIIKGHLDRMSERNVERIVSKYANIVRKSKPELSVGISPHTLRRTRATGWYRDGVNIEAIALVLGHADTQTTRKHYAKPSPEMIRNEMSKSYDPSMDGQKETPLWKDDEDLARMCGLR